MEGSYKFVPSRSTKYFSSISKVAFLFGLPNFSVDRLSLPNKFVKLYSQFSTAVNWFLYIVVLLELGSFFTQHNLTEKQMSDRLVFGLSQPIMSTYRLIMVFHRDRVKKLLYKLSVELKVAYNDEVVELDMIKKSKFYFVAFLILCFSSIMFFGVDALMRSLKTGVVFSTLITAWPDIADTSAVAGVARAACYAAWWVLMARVAGCFALILSMLVCLEHQYKNLQSYFRNLGNIFTQRNLDQYEKERKYEQGLKIGIKLHSETLWCKEQVEDSFGMIFVGQIVLNISVLVILMVDMLRSERSVETVFATVTTSGATLLSTGVIMWTAGDITVEASRLPTAIYDSGWENCEHSSVATRKLVVTTMAQAQEPVIIQSFGLVQFSYQTYLATAERTATAVAPIVCSGMTMLIGTGVIMCNAGDITEESGELPTAVYGSGWHECRAAAARRLVALTVAQAQKPVVIWALFTVPLSYESYVSIVKSSYSVFSVIY